MIRVPSLRLRRQTLAARIKRKHVKSSRGKVGDLLLPDFGDHHQPWNENQLASAAAGIEVVHLDVADLEVHILPRFFFRRECGERQRQEDKQ